MRNFRGVAGSVSVAAFLVGCAAQPPAPPPPAPAVAAAPAAKPASGGIDGVYRPTAGRVSGNSGCGTTTFNFPIRVTNGVASMMTVMNGALDGPVGPDGMLSIERGRALLRGQFANGQFNGTYSTGRCAFTLAYSK